MLERQGGRRPACVKELSPRYIHQLPWDYAKKQALAELQQTLDELGALCGVSRDDLGSYELGKVTPRSATVQKIAQALGVPITAIQGGMGWTEQEPAERWETDGSAPLREGILETVRESRGEGFTPGG